MLKKQSTYYHCRKDRRLEWRVELTLAQPREINAREKFVTSQ
jgi:hypothetical protein